MIHEEGVLVATIGIVVEKPFLLLSLLLGWLTVLVLPPSLANFCSFGREGICMAGETPETQTQIPNSGKSPLILKILKSVDLNDDD